MSDHTEFRFVLEWQVKSPAGVLKDYAESEVYREFSTAKEQHAERCKGRWVQHGMLNPHVSALRVWKGGRILTEELRPKRDVPEFARAATEDAPRQRHLQPVNS